MRLHSISVGGMCRFEDQQTLQLLSKLTAIVGENEAGKSSLLRAIQYFDGSKEIPAFERTSLTKVQPLIVGTYVLSEEDCQTAQIGYPTSLTVEKTQDGKRTYSFNPKPTRDIKFRQEILRKIRTKKFRTILSDEKDEVFESDAISEDEISAIIDRNADAIDSKSLERLSEIAGKQEGLGDGWQILPYLQELQRLVDFEKKHEPEAEAWNALAAKIPKIVNFTPDYRRVNIPYEILNFGEADKEQPSRALMEMIHIAELDIETLKSVIESGDAAAREGIITAANSTLSEKFSEKWSQSDAVLHFQVTETELNVVVKNTSNFDSKYRFTNLEQRSDGYRQFIALQLFILSHDLQGAILLLDEIEHHLHYDAQADLVQMLQREPRVGQVVYSTHSIGSLPEDLGLGVRLVRWNPQNPKRSIIVNKFWQQEGDAGFKPLLFGMGATTLAFFPTRKALVSEGPTELLLLPKMLKQSLGVDSLDFQVVHGLANLSPTGLSMVDRVGSGVCYLVDNDAAGSKIRSNLEAVGVKASSIFCVSDFLKSAVTTEDLIDADVWMRAVNDVASIAGVNENVIKSKADVPENDRIKALPAKLKQSKISFCYSIIRQLEENPDLSIISKAAKPGLKRVTGKLTALLYKQ